MHEWTPTRTSHTIAHVRGAGDDLHARHTRTTHVIGASEDLHARVMQMTHILCTTAPLHAHHTPYIPLCTSATMPHLDIDVDTDSYPVATLTLADTHGDVLAEPQGCWSRKYTSVLDHVFHGPATPATTWPPSGRTSWPPHA